MRVYLAISIALLGVQLAAAWGSRFPCGGVIEDPFTHNFTAQEDGHCPTEELFAAWEEQVGASFCRPRRALVELDPGAEHQFHPRMVEVWRCLGDCTGGVCYPTTTKRRRIQVTRTNILTVVTKCGVVDVQDHTSCECGCNLTCPSRQVLDERSCRCRCPNEAERFACPRARWDEAQCNCY